jgi:hypothetical protein
VIPAAWLKNGNACAARFYQKTEARDGFPAQFPLNFTPSTVE